MANKIQNFENLPEEIKNTRRFFLVGKDKRPLQKDWSNPKVQKSYTEIDGLAGFDTVGHGVGDDYLFLDFDHVLNTEGDFVNETVSDFYLSLTLTFENIYSEKSISGTGLHLFMKPTPNKFQGITNSAAGVLHFDNSTDKNAPKLELFYGSGGRYCLVTGNLYDCDEGAVIPSGAEVDDFFTNLLAEIQTQLQERGIVKPARTDKEPNIFADDEIIKHVEATDTPAEYKHDLCIACFNYINGANLERGDWLPIITALKAENFSQAEVKAMCQSSSRYNEKNFDKEWQSLTDLAGYGVETLIGKAAGFDFKNFYRQWYKEHPQYQKAKFDSEEDKLAADEKAFEEEKAAAIEHIKNLMTFDNKTVTNVETLEAAAFCKIFDLQTYSQFKAAIQAHGKKHTEEKTDLRDLAAALKPFEEKISSRRSQLDKRRLTFEATKKSSTFIAKNEILTNFVTPYDYEISADGVFKIVEKDKVKICRLPLILAEKIYSIEDKTFKARLAFKVAGKWHYSPPIDLETVSNHRQITKLSNSDVPVTSANAYNIVEYIDAFRAENEAAIPVTCTVRNCGWRKVDDKEIFIDPRRKLTITGSSGTAHKLIVEDSAFAQNLKTVGSLQEWRRIYNLAKNYPVARFIVAAAVTPPLLKILDERNFAVYTYGTTRAGKTTALLLAVSAVGSLKMVRTFDSTKNGLLGAAADANDYVFAVDEKQSADRKILEQLATFVYSYCEGRERGRAGRNGEAKLLREWRGVLLMTGETRLFFEGVTGGAFTRALQLKLRKEVLPEKICADIRRTIKDNHGHALPLIIEEIERRNFKELREMYYEITTEIQSKTKDFPPEYIRYIARVTLADFILNFCLNKNDGNFDEDSILNNSIQNAFNILKLVPTQNEIADATHAEEIVSGGISKYQSRFIGAVDKVQTPIYGKVDKKQNRLYITVEGLKDLCKIGGLADAETAISLLVGSGYLKPQTATQKKVGILGNRRCYWVPIPDASEDDEDGGGGENES